MSSGKTEGEIPSPIAGFQNKTFIVPPLSSLSQSCIGGASRSLCARSRNLHRHCPHPGTPIALSLGHSTKSKRNYTRTSKGETSPWLHRRRDPQCGSAVGQCYAQFPPQANEKGDVRTENDECAHQTSTKKRRKELKKKERRGPPHHSFGETKKNRGLLSNKWRLSAKNPRLLSVEVGETRSRLAVRRRMCNFAHNLTPQQFFP